MAGRQGIYRVETVIEKPTPTEAEQKLIPNSVFRVVDSLWAHFAMFCMTPREKEQIDQCIADLLAEKMPG